jgi:hypothetical protein
MNPLKQEKCMAGSQGGSHEQHVKAGQQSSGGSHEQHVKAGEQSHKNTGSGSSSQDKKSGESKSSTQGGSHEQHVKAGEQSQKNK